MDSQSALSLYLKPDPSLPAAYWNRMSQEDKVEFIKLRNTLHQNQKPSITVKDGRLISFTNEMKTILKFIEHDEVGRELRSILSGVAFAGPYICVNTRQLKNFLGRCKSSINGSLQQLGYVAVRTKSKARSCVLAVMPLLANDVNLLRQWTVRGASEEALFCFVSNFQPNPMPVILPEDLNEDRKGMSSMKSPKTLITDSINTPTVKNLPKNASAKKANNSANFQTPQQKIQEIIRHVLLNAPQQKLNLLNSSTSNTISISNTTSNNTTNSNTNDPDFSLPVTGFISPDIFNFNSFDMTPSFSNDYLNKYGDSFENEFENGLINDYENEWNIQSHRTVPRSHSAFFSASCDDWKATDISPLFF